MIPGRGTKILHAAWRSQKNKKQKKESLLKIPQEKKKKKKRVQQMLVFVGVVVCPLWLTYPKFKSSLLKLPGSLTPAIFSLQRGRKWGGKYWGAR